MPAATGRLLTQDESADGPVEAVRQVLDESVNRPVEAVRQVLKTSQQIGER